MRLKPALVRLCISFSELLRILCMQLVLVPAAVMLPRRWALALAKSLSLFLAVLPVPGISTYLNMSVAFEGDPFRSFLRAWAWLARPFQDYVIMRRIQFGRENLDKWRISEKNADELSRLRSTRQPFIIATGHFERVALLGINCPKVTPGNLVSVSAPPKKRMDSLYNLRISIQYRSLLKVLSSIWHRPFEFAFAGAGQLAAYSLFRRLKESGSIVVIHVDAPWPQLQSGTYSRPFAGHHERTFSTGAAQLAQLARCPIVSCIYWQEDDGSIILEWGSPIEKVDNQIDTMNLLIDRIEKAVGERPERYVLDIGKDRRWNSQLRRWENL